MSLRPMYDNIIVKPIKAEEKTAGGIYLNNADAAQQYAEAEVIAVGEGYRVDGDVVALKVKPGDTILYRKMVEISLTDDNGDEVLLLSEANILAIKE